MHLNTRQTTHGKRKKRNDNAGWRSIGPLGKPHNIAVFIRIFTVRNDAWGDIAGKAVGIDNITRWNSWFKLLDAAISQEVQLSIFLNQYHNELEDDILTHGDWQVLKMTHELLQPFYQATIPGHMVIYGFLGHTIESWVAQFLLIPRLPLERTTINAEII